MAQATDGIDVWIAAAHPLELETLRARFAGAERTSVGERTIAASHVGVGLALAAAGAMHGLLELRPRAVVLVGSCGVYGESAAFRPGQVMIPAHVRLLDAAELAGDAAFPQPMPRALDTARELSEALAAGAHDVLRGTLATTLGITTSDALAARLSESGCAAENLEAIGVALACRERGVPFAAVLGVTNRVGAEGRAQWLQHRALAASTTAELVLGWLRAGAPGVTAR
jgi:nucleoside phosphorylase